MQQMWTVLQHVGPNHLGFVVTWGVSAGDTHRESRKSGERFSTATSVSLKLRGTLTGEAVRLGAVPGGGH